MLKNEELKIEEPKIGLNRTFIRNVGVDPYSPSDPSTNILQETKNDVSIYENILAKSYENITKYKNGGCKLVYSDIYMKKNKLINNNTNVSLNSNLVNSDIKNDMVYSPGCVIYYSDLLNILSADADSFENFIDSKKGQWVDKIEEKESDTQLNKNNINYSDTLLEKETKSKDILQFESRFESGNLRMAIKIDDFEYDLILKNDINAGRSYHWFYFQIQVLIENLLSENNSDPTPSTDEELEFKFNIINCQKNDMLFSKGLKILKYSEENKIWSRDTNNIYYFFNGITFEEKKLCTLTFSIKLKKFTSDNKFYLAYCYPYTYSDLSRYLQKVSSIKGINGIMKKETLCQTLSGNNLDMLIITNFESTFEEIAVRPAVVLTARVHPGETNSSFAIQGVIDFLTNIQDEVAISLRDSYIFKIVPMLNPDGVINGNFRTSLVGKDLNRMWSDPRENMCPTIFNTKEMIRKTLISRPIFLFCDFHGHSNKNNFFMYACNSNNQNNVRKSAAGTSSNASTNSNGLNNNSSSLKEYVLPYLFSKLNDYFDPQSCIYKINQSKIKTARAVVKNEFSVDLSYCLESSVGSITLGKNKNTFFTPEKWMKIGSDFCLVLHQMSREDNFNDLILKVAIEEANKLVESNKLLTNTNESSKKFKSKIKSKKVIIKKNDRNDKKELVNCLTEINNSNTINVIGSPKYSLNIITTSGNIPGNTNKNAKIKINNVTNSVNVKSPPDNLSSSSTSGKKKLKPIVPKTNKMKSDNNLIAVNKDSKDPFPIKTEPYRQPTKSPDGKKKNFKIKY